MHCLSNSILQTKGLTKQRYSQNHDVLGKELGV